MIIGVLALQGAFREHIEKVELLGHEAVAVRTKDELNHLDGLILPGGESTVMGKLMDQLNLVEPIKELINNGLPVWGTCAGMILLSKNHDHLKVMDIKVKRNAYGNQSGSFTRTVFVEALNDTTEMVFIRAPYITDTSVDVLSTVDEYIVAARQGHMLATAFHPELTQDLKFHQYFIEMVSSRL